MTGFLMTGALPVLLFPPPLVPLQVRAVIPRRNDLPGDRGVLIVSYASHKKKAYSFFLVQVGMVQ